MPNPKKKHTPSRRDMRRAANWRVEAVATVRCPQCGAPRLPHHVCPACGFYNGELIVAKKDKKKQEGATPEEGK
ncbi:MAG: 50S ribosomal protein L32 [Elusimicrobia bacterium RIFOXYA2_FULL_50_26]|nr:MAG: 50S ribosomal protein L32 [Elusimicrobia bacterium RIFOXYA2_FULL_50_26]OGS22851.1 MAG: 50S ribosomal protein L32 [Elusimicrobia bacterium RIFOXYB2_FULL_50_12]